MNPYVSGTAEKFPNMRRGLRDCLLRMRLNIICKGVKPASLTLINDGGLPRFFGPKHLHDLRRGILRRSKIGY